MKIIERIVNTETGETVDIERQLSSQELAERKESEAKFAAQEAEAEAKAQAKAEAEGKLAALGLTTDDLRALGL
jgi:hypothetical protein